MNDLEKPIIGETNKQHDPEILMAVRGLVSDHTPKKQPQSSLVVTEKAPSSHLPKVMRKVSAADLRSVDRELSHQANKEGYKRTKIEEEREADLVRKIHELKAKKPLPEKEAAELKALYLEHNAIKEANTKKRTKVQLNSEQRMSLKDKIDKAKIDAKDATKNEGEFIKERSELMDDNDKLGKDIDELSEEIKSLGNKTGKEREEATALLKSLRSEKRRVENVLTGYKPDGDLARGEYIAQQLTEAIFMKKKTAEELEAARRETGAASSETLAEARNNEARAGTAAGAALVAEKDAEQAAIGFLKAHTTTPAEAGAVHMDTGKEDEAAARKRKGGAIGPGMEKVADGIFDYTKKESREMQKEMNALLPKPHEAISGPMQPAKEPAPAVDKKAAPETQKPSHEKTSAVTQGALELLESAKKGVPTFISKHMRRTAEANGVHISEHDTPNSVIERLREKATAKNVPPETQGTLMSAKDYVQARNSDREQMEEIKKTIIRENKDIQQEATKHWGDEKAGGVDFELSPEEAVKKEIEALPLEEQKKVSLGLAGWGFKSNKLKNELLARGFDFAAKIAGKDNWLGGRLQSLSLISERDASVSRNSLRELAEKKERGGGTKFKELIGAGTLLGNATALVRVMFDIFGGGIAARAATRGAMAAAMVVAVGVEMEKEYSFTKKREGEYYKIKKAEFTTEQQTAFDEAMKMPPEGQMTEEEIEERAWQAANAFNPDVTKVHEEAIRIMDEAKKRTDALDKNGKLKTEALEKAFQENVPRDILARLAQNEGSALGLIERHYRDYIKKEAEELNNQLKKIDATELSSEQKESQKNSVLNGFFKTPAFRDFNKAIDQAGTVDTTFMFLRRAQQIANVPKYVMIAETLCQTLWNGLPKLINAASSELYDYNHPINPEAVAASNAEIKKIFEKGEALKLVNIAALGAHEKILDLATIKEGEGVENSFIRQLVDRPGDFGFKGDAADPQAVKEWAGGEAHRIAIKTGYVDLATGKETGVATAGINKVAYVLEKDASGNVKIEEQLEGTDGKFHAVDAGSATKNAYEYERSPAPSVTPARTVSAEEFLNPPLRTEFTPLIPENAPEVPKDAPLVGHAPPTSPEAPNTNEVASHETSSPAKEATPATAPTEKDSAEKVLSSTQPTTQANKILEGIGAKASFTYLADGKVGGFVSDEGFAKADTEKLMNDRWQYTVRTHTTPEMQQSRIEDVGASARKVAGYEHALQTLEQKNLGTTPEADFLRDQIKTTVEQVEKENGDVFKNPADFNKPEQIAPTSAISPEILPGKPGIAMVDGLEMTNNPQALADADIQIHENVKAVWGKSGFPWIGNPDGMEVFKNYENKTIKEIFTLPSIGIDKQMQGFLNEALKQTNVKWSEKEEAGAYLHRAIAVAIDKLPKAPNDVDMP